MYQFIHPFGAVISGPSSSGKSTLVVEILNNSHKLINVKFHRILWCYAEESTVVTISQKLNKEQKRKITFVKGIPDIDENWHDAPQLIILDDLMTESSSAKAISELFTRGCHHRNLSVFLITQNLFNQEKYYRTISLNSKYIIHFKSPRDSLQFANLARQMGNPNLVQVYKDISKKSHGYIFMDLSQDIHHLLRYRSDVLEECCSVYCDVASDPDVKHETITGHKAYLIHAI